jgi:hypothetical protein
MGTGRKVGGKPGIIPSPQQGKRGNLPNMNNKNKNLKKLYSFILCFMIETHNSWSNP